ncbi:MAG TPA: class I SAM-dependent rRNA methyltransferase [Chryseosolibacter sp.]|nr:class I SAM-dependent rRNA methyltransferase [Chryseosolibacter sp.]
MTTSGKVILKKGKEISIQRFHPWVFSGAIQKLEGAVADGCWVEVADWKNETLGFGHYQNGSIAVRMLSFDQDAPAPHFWESRIAAALAVRNSADLPSADTNAFRIIHGEGDELPGLIVDYYAGTAVMQAHSIGMHADRQQIAHALREVLGDRVTSIYYKSQSTLPGKMREAYADEYLFGERTQSGVISENGNQFHVDWLEGQKTGFFLDQRENRRLLGDFARGKKVLNTFCYTGGFSIYALKGGASLVHSVDASQRAIDMTEKNIALNAFDPVIHRCFALDCFEFFKESKDEYDVMVLDPPAFAKHRDARHQAVRGYQRLNAEAMRKIRSGGIIFTFSCSQVVDRQLFYDTIVSAAIQARRQVSVLHHLSQPADHPVSMFHPEGEYLKGLVLYVR